MRKKPNQELFGLLRFAIKYAHEGTPFQSDCLQTIKKGERLGFFKVDYKNKLFSLASE